MNEEAKQLVARLGLERLPHEGGWFRQTWLSAVRLADGRPAGSAIYFLITPGDFSALHRMKTDEVWLFHAGDAVEHVTLAHGGAQVTRVGGDVAAGEVPQLAVPGGVWQGARLAQAGTRGWALLSCTMAPAWDEREFELGQREPLALEFPLARAPIEALTR
jgi:predicted cupin superfamily sugar epimerase